MRVPFILRRIKLYDIWAGLPLFSPSLKYKTYGVTFRDSLDVTLNLLLIRHYLFL